METIVLTGATGFLGSHFLFQTLRSGQYRVICLGRASTPAQLAERTLNALEEAAVSYRQREDVGRLLSRCEWVCGDMAEPELGLPAEARAAMAEWAPTAIWHFAASLQYEEGVQAQIEETNVAGTGRVLDLAHGLGIERFFYISTAYVNGALSGDIGNTLNETGRFNNHYERSKQMAEKLVIASGLDYAILRPSIVIGNSETYLAGGAKTGFYSFLRELQKVAKVAEKQQCRVRVKASKGAYLDLVAVDQFTRDCFNVAGMTDRSTRIFNCTADKVCMLDDMRGCLDFIDVNTVDVVEQVDQMTPIEAIIEKRTAFFSSYINNGSLRFIRTAPGSAGVTLKELNQYAANGISIRSSCIFTGVEHLSTSVGGRIRYRHIDEGREQAVLIVNAYGMPLDFWEHIVETLRPQYDIYAIEFARSGERSVASEFQADVDDIVALAHHVGKPVHMLSWCSGSMLAVVASTRIDNLVSSAYISGGYILSERQAALREVAAVTRRLYERVSESEAAGRSIFNALFRNMRSNMRSRNIDVKEDINFVLSTMNPAYLDWISAIFDDFATFRSFATKLVHLWQSPVDSCLSQMRGVKLFMIGDEDASVDPQVTLEVARRVPDSECWLIDKADHWVLHSDARVHNKLSAFLASRTPASRSECSP